MLYANQQIRQQACLALQKIAFEGRSATDLLAKVQFEQATDTSLFKSLVLGSCRYFIRLKEASEHLLKKPLRTKDQDLLCLILVGLYQIEFSRIPDHAAISETVNSCELLNKTWATKLVNGVLRSYLRQQQQLQQQLDLNWHSKYSVPEWIINRLKPDYKGKVDSILENSNQQAPLSLRVNLNKTSRQDYLQLLEQEGLSATAHPLVKSAIVLEQAVNVVALPHFDAGWISVQDPAAQLASWILQPQANNKVLDACAAPGGKTAHLLEFTNNQLDLTAIDIDPSRCQRIEENLQRIQLDAKVVCSDALEHFKVIKQQGPDSQYQQILLDVPCSASGVIRRHPDIKLLRRDTDIEELVAIQQQLLQQAWQVLRPGGQLLYATCSIFAAENSQQIEQFIKQTANAKITPLDEELQSLSHSEIGCQLLPNQLQMDGFYYCLLQKL